MMGVLSGLPSCPTATPPRTVVLAVYQALRDKTPHLTHNTPPGLYTPFTQEEPRALRHGGPTVGRAELSPQPSAHPTRLLQRPPAPSPAPRPPHILLLLLLVQVDGAPAHVLLPVRLGAAIGRALLVPFKVLEER